MAIIIDGKACAEKFNQETLKLVNEFTQKVGRAPALAVILVGTDPASQVYVRNKVKTCAAVGIKSLEMVLPETTTQEELLSLVQKLNCDKEVDGLLVQSPLPKHLDEGEVISIINPDKDVDCFTERNVGRMLIGEVAGLQPCTPKGVVELLKFAGVETSGKHAVIVGRSNIVGKPLAALLVQKKPGPNATVTVVHSGTKDIASITKQADILIAAVGKANFITADMVKEGAAVIDVGINRIFDETLQKNRLVGDVDFASVEKVAGAITPVPGGVGPMTIAMLMRNTLMAAAIGANADGLA